MCASTGGGGLGGDRRRLSAKNRAEETSGLSFSIKRGRDRLRSVVVGAMPAGCSQERAPTVPPCGLPTAWGAPPLRSAARMSGAEIYGAARAGWGLVHDRQVHRSLGVLHLDVVPLPVLPR